MSIPDQRKHGETYYASRGHQPVETFVEAGASATNDGRREFQRMIEAGATVLAATVRRYHYETHQHLPEHLAAFLTAYNFARRLKCVRRDLFVISTPDPQPENSPPWGMKSPYATVRIYGASSVNQGCTVATRKICSSSLT